MKKMIDMKLLLAVPVLLLAACESKKDAELAASVAAGHGLIEEARVAYRAGDYDKALVLIDSVRVAHPRAMNAREDGILLKDSVEMAKAEMELKQLADTGNDNAELWDEAQRKLKFFARKLQYDKEQRKQH